MTASRKKLIVDTIPAGEENLPIYTTVDDVKKCIGLGWVVHDGNGSFKVEINLDQNSAKDLGLDVTWVQTNTRAEGRKTFITVEKMKEV